METAMNGDSELASEVVGFLGRELKAARKKVKELETHLEERESSAQILQKSVEDAGVENEKLRKMVEELRDSKVGVKKEPSDLIMLRATSERGVLTDGPSTVETLQESLETIHKKYKKERESKKEWKRSFQESEKRAAEVEAQNKELVRKSKSREPSVHSSNSTALTLPVKPSRREDPKCFMLSLPKFTKRPPINDIGPIAVKGVNLSSVLALDPILSPLSNNFLYLPGRVIWCDSEFHHAIGLGPLHTYDEEKDLWSKKSTFTNLYDKSLTLFYLWNGHIYYGGLYKAINMRAWNPDGSPINASFVSHAALADATIEDKDSPSTTLKHCRKAVIMGLYKNDALKVEYLGLQCVGFDHRIYKHLRNFFEVSERMQVVKGDSRVGQRHPETTRGVKRQRLH